MIMTTTNDINPPLFLSVKKMFCKLFSVNEMKSVLCSIFVESNWDWYVSHISVLEKLDHVLKEILRSKSITSYLQ